MILGLFVGCVPVGTNDKTTEVESELLRFEGSRPEYGIRIYKFEYNGHQYLQFGSGDHQSVVHDPDCKCHKNNNNNNLFDW